VGQPFFVQTKSIWSPYICWKDIARIQSLQIKDLPQGFVKLYNFHAADLIFSFWFATQKSMKVTDKIFWTFIYK